MKITQKNKKNNVEVSGASASGTADNKVSKETELLAVPIAAATEAPRNPSGDASSEALKEVTLEASPDEVVVGGVENEESNSEFSATPKAPGAVLAATDGTAPTGAELLVAAEASAKDVASRSDLGRLWRQRTMNTVADEADEEAPSETDSLASEAISVGDEASKAARKLLKRQQKQKRRRQRKLAERSSEKSIEQISDQLSGLLQDESTLEAGRPGKKFKGASSGISIPSSTPKVSWKDHLKTATRSGLPEVSAEGNGHPSSTKVDSSSRQTPQEEGLDIRPSTSVVAAERAKRKKPVSNKAGGVRGGQPKKAVNQAKLPVPKQVLPSGTLDRAHKRRAEPENGVEGKSPHAKKTYAQVAEVDLVMGVIDLSCEGGLKEAHLSTFKASLLNALDSLEDDVNDIGFVGSAKVERGFISLRCKNQQSKEWLRKAVEHLPGLWEGAKLKCEKLLDLSENRRMVIVAHGTTESSDVILRRLQRQNNCVKDTSNWSVIRTEKFGEAEKVGVVLTVLCPKNDAEAIKIAGGKLNCGLEQAVVKFQRDGV